MAELAVEERPLGRLWRVRGADRRPHPRAGGVGAVLVGVAALEDEDLLAAAMDVVGERFAGVPAEEIDPLEPVLVQQELVIGLGLALLEGRGARVDDDARQIVRRELAELDEERAAFAAEG